MIERKYKLTNLKRITFIDGGVIGEAENLVGEKYYDVICDICCEDKYGYEELKSLHFRMEEEDLNKFLLSKKMLYDKEKREFEIL